MRLSSIDAGYFKLDGGAMFGVVPKSIWQKTNPSDELNLCSWAQRCLLVEDGKRLVLIDTGMGNKQPAKWQNFYFRHGHGDLIKQIRAAGYHEDQITDCILSHLHFDHCGGAVTLENETLKPQFCNATYWTHSLHWAAAIKPNQREKATFLTENILPLEQSGQLAFIDQANTLPPSIAFLVANGHTESMLMPLIHYKSHKIWFAADTIPSASHIPIPYVMGYDTQPLVTMTEKEDLLKRALVENWIMFYDHDPYADCGALINTEKGIRTGERFNLTALG